jgi:hypothetical protein
MELKEVVLERVKPGASTANPLHGVESAFFE